MLRMPSRLTTSLRAGMSLLSSSSTSALPWLAGGLDDCGGGSRALGPLGNDGIRGHHDHDRRLLP